MSADLPDFIKAAMAPDARAIAEALDAHPGTAASVDQVEALVGELVGHSLVLHRSYRDEDGASHLQRMSQVMELLEAQRHDDLIQAVVGLLAILGQALMRLPR